MPKIDKYPSVEGKNIADDDLLLLETVNGTANTKVSEFIDRAKEGITDGMASQQELEDLSNQVNKDIQKVHSDVYGTEKELEILLHSIQATTTTKYTECDLKKGDKVRITAPSPNPESSVKEQLKIGYISIDGAQEYIFDSTDLKEEVNVVYEFTEDAVQLFTKTWNWNNVLVNVYLMTKEFFDGLVPDVKIIKNTFVTPQMYGAKGDGITDDTSAIQKALDESNCVYLPQGVYLTSDTLRMHSNQTIFGCGRESKIINTVLSGANKTIIIAGAVNVGSADNSYLLLQSDDCSIGSDNKSVTVTSTEGYHVGDIIIISGKNFDGNKNPKYYWNAKIVDIANNILSLDTYIENEQLLSEECVIRNMSGLPVENDVKENVCIHDLSLEHKFFDSGSGMYCIGLSAYKGSIYNVWTKGNTAIGANYAVDVVVDNVSAEFDGGFCDIPEINQNVVIQSCVGRKYGDRLNIIGLTFLQGYGVVIKNNRFIFDGHGSVKTGAHINPTILGNEFRNVGASEPPVYLSKYGNSILKNNIITLSNLSSNQSVIYQSGNGNVIEDNIVKNTKGQRWLYGYNTFDHDRNRITNNIITDDFFSDTYFNDILGNRLMTSASKYVGIYNTVTLNPNESYSCFTTNNDNPIPRRLTHYKLMFAKECSIKIGFVFNDGTTKEISISAVSVLDLYVPRNNYINYVKNGSSLNRITTNKTNGITELKITVTSEESTMFSGIKDVIIE